MELDRNERIVDFEDVPEKHKNFIIDALVKLTGMVIIQVDDYSDERKYEVRRITL